MASCTAEDSPREEDGQWKCPMCLEILKRPKLLPCSHTFCEACLDDLVKHHPKGSFPCPSCRERVTVPRGGVSAFKNNFYLQEPDKGSEKPMCKNHKKPREIELFCLDCNACICLECKLTSHMGHYTEDILNRAETAKAQLCRDKMELQSVIEDLKRHLEEFRHEQQAVQDRREAVKKDILDRHRLMMEAADRCREESLFSLDTVTASIKSQLCLIDKDLQKTLDGLAKLHKRVDMCVKSEKGHGLLLTIHDIYNDASRYVKEVAMHKATKITRVSRPVLCFSAAADATLQTQEKFLGPVVRLDIEVGMPAVTVKKVFGCKQQTFANNDVFSLFPRADDAVWVAYEPSPQSVGTPARHPELYDLSGQVIETEASICGRTNFTHTNSGMGMCITPSPWYFSTYAKSRSLCKLKNNMKGEACVISIIVNSESPLKTLQSVKHKIKCGPHRAFDMDDREVCFAIVEEGQGPDFIRKVHVYRAPHETPLDTYTPPTQPFQPSDVCFFTMAGRQILLVSDEASNAIHVVDMVKDRLQFLRYLAPGCPVMLQPKALNTDVRGRLWVACRNGSILLCDPVLHC
ncbi:uncharacterized protein [Littorina saxatilis]|uniref:Uncharacterized protein n=1 Tax=Littorina saxatilis TaxID=31220 RepID=A0AAN9G2L4_9CAEN